MSSIRSPSSRRGSTRTEVKLTSAAVRTELGPQCEADDRGGCAAEPDVILARTDDQREVIEDCGIAGPRTAYFFFDMKDSSQMPVIAEPWFFATGARIEFLPAMNSEELKTGFDGGLKK